VKKVGGKPGCCRGTSPIATIWFTGGIYPSDSTLASGSVTADLGSTHRTLAPVPAARAI